MARKLGFSRQQYQKYEIGNNRFPLIHLIRVCNYFGLNSSEVIELSINKTNKGIKNKLINENTVIYHNHNYYNGFFSNLFKMDLTLMKNKIVLITVITNISIYLGINVLKFFPINMAYNHVFLSTQVVLMSISLAIIMFAVFGYSILTYVTSFIAYGGVVFTIDRLINYIVLASSNNLKKFIDYLLAVALTFLTFYILKKCKVNINTPKNKKEA